MQLLQQFHGLKMATDRRRRSGPKFGRCTPALRFEHYQPSDLFLFLPRCTQDPHAAERESSAGASRNPAGQPPPPPRLQQRAPPSGPPRTTAISLVPRSVVVGSPPQLGHGWHEASANSDCSSPACSCSIYCATPPLYSPSPLAAGCTLHAPPSSSSLGNPI